MPRCRHCQRKLATWRGLQHHIERAQFQPDPPCQVAHIDLPELRAYAATEGWQALTENTGLMEKIRGSCIMCNKVFQCGKDLLAHLQRMHYTIWNESKFHTSRVIGCLRRCKPCSACGRDISSERNCHAIRQMAILQMMTANNHFSHDVLTGAPKSIDPRPPDADHPVPDQVKRLVTPQTSRDEPSLAEDVRGRHRWLIQAPFSHPRLFQP